jgi:hypothetical protein
VSSAAFIQQILLGLEEAFAGLRDELESGAPLGVLDRLGWIVPSNTDLEEVRSGFQALSGALDGLSNAAQSLAALPEDASLEDFAPLVSAMTDVIAQTIAAIQELSDIDASAFPPPFSSEELWASFAEEAFDTVLIRYLEHHQKVSNGILRVLGVIVEEPVAATAVRSAYVSRRFDWDRLAKVFSKPSEIPADVYGWGDDFDADLLLRNLVALFEGFNLTPALYYPPKSLADLYYSPTNPAHQSLRQLSLPIYWEKDPNDPSSDELAIDLQIGLLPIPAVGDMNGPAAGLVLFPSLAGGAAVTFEITDSADLEIAGGFQAALVRLDVHPDSASFNVLPVAGEFSGSAAVIGAPDTPWILLGTANSTRLELDGAHVKLGAKGSTSTIEFLIEAGIDGARIVIQLDESDGFIGKVLGTEPIEVPFALLASWSSKTGLRFEGEIGINLRLPLNLSFGGVFTLDALYIELRAGTDGKARIILAVAAGVKLGPVSGAVDKIGLALNLAARPETAPPGNLGPLELGFGFKPPDGAGMGISAGPITGGGYIFFDPENEQYAGILQLSFKTIGITAIGLLTTRLPDPAGPPGSTKKGFSLLIIITVDLPPIQLGYGFTLNGVGGLLGINRTMVIDVLRDGVRNRTVEAILFPQDPIARAAEIISTLRSVFPPAEGRFVFGPMVKLGWGPNSLIELQVALVLELMSPIKLVVLGRIQLALPDKKDAVLNLRLDIVGVLDFDRGEVSVDASLVDSRLVVFVITGDMAIRVGWGASKIFVIAAGGFHPRFLAPPGFPSLRRLGIALADSDNPRIRMETYLALTANTFQIGAGLDVYAKMDTFVGTFSVQALMGFDALIQFQPFQLTAELGASVDILRNDTPLLHAAVHATLSGPEPWHIVGYAEFECLGKHRIDVEATIGEPKPAPPIVTLPSVLLEELLKAFERPDAWGVLPPVDADRIVTLRDQPAGGRIRVHPLGSLSARQRVLPLGKVIERFGTAEVAATTFGLNGFRIGVSQATEQPAEFFLDDFAPGQFTPLSDDERVARPAFEAMRSGGRVNVKAFRASANTTSPSTDDYDSFIVDDEPLTGTRVASATAAGQAAFPSATLAILSAGGAAGHAATRSGGAADFAGTKGLAITVGGERFVAADANTLAADQKSGAGTSAAEAHDVNAAAPAGEPRQIALTHEAA